MQWRILNDAGQLGAFTNETYAPIIKILDKY
jgi:hypothetical protein